MIYHGLSNTAETVRGKVEMSNHSLWLVAQHSSLCAWLPFFSGGLAGFWSYNH
jgi:hypothetical protein